MHQPIDAARLIARFAHYADSAGVSGASIKDLVSVLQSPLGYAVLQAPPGLLDRWLLDDAYKLRMHKMYATFMTGDSA
jgi:hypothetical protein